MPLRPLRFTEANVLWSFHPDGVPPLLQLADGYFRLRWSAEVRDIVALSARLKGVPLHKRGHLIEVLYRTSTGVTAGVFAFSRRS